MRFVFVSYNYSPDINTPGDWINRINFYVGSLERLSKTNTVIRIDQINYEGDFIDNGVQYFCIKPKKKKNYFPRKLNRFVRSLAPDVVVVSSFLFPLQVIQLRLCLGKKIKIIVQHHAERPYTGIKKFLQRQASRFIDAYIFASYEIGADWAKRGNLINEKKIHEIVGGTSVFYPIEKSTAKQKTEVEGSIVFLWAGRFNANKDPLTVIKAFLKFAAIQPGVKLYMIYQTTELLNDVKSLIAENKNSKESIALVGPVQHSEMSYWLNSADFLVSGSHYEGSGTVICEAMSCSCIPVVTDIPSFRAITANGECALLYEAGSENALLSALKQTMTIDLEDMRNKILKHFKDELSFEAIARKLHEVAASL